MSDREALSLIARRWISLWTVPVDWAAFEELHAHDFEDASSAGRPVTREGFAQGLRDLVDAFPDLHTRVEDLVIDTQERRVAIRWSAEGTNRSCYLGIGPTNRLRRITGIEIIEVRNDRVVRRWGEWDIIDHTGR
ncbi:MAG: ester cyclase [Dehalococcoidia bacterium]